MIKTKKCEIPSDSLVAEYLPADYKDSFCVVQDKEITATPDDLMVRFWTDMPGWVNTLFKLRNFLVKFVGLEGAKGSQEELENCIRNGSNYRFVEIVAKDERETVMLLRDKHLDAYISLRVSDGKNVYANTLVKYNNRLGKVYFFVIRPFHGIVVRAAMKRIVEHSM